MDAASVLYDPEPGTYTVTVVDTDIEFDITVEAPTAVFYQPCDVAGTHLNNIDVGETVYLSAANGTEGDIIHVYVAPNRYDWEYGMYLYDYTESVEELTFDAAGQIPVTSIWQAANNTSGASWDVVIDVNRNNVYDAGDYLDGQIGVGFVVQEEIQTKILIDGHVVERLSSDVRYVYRDLFNTDENVYVYVNPVARMRNLGSNRYVKWYIVPHQAVWNDQDPLTPVTSPLGDTVQYGCTNAGRRLVWPAPLTPGQYDVLIDVDGDELYDKGQDFIDGYSGPGDWVGFTVQDEPETKDWTVLVYADGEGGLSGTRSQYATEIATAMDGDTYAGVLFDGDNAVPEHNYCKRYVCSSGGTVTEDADYGDLNMGQALTLYDFLVWGIAKFPANHYMIVLSNHGGSWFNESHPVPNELDYDEAGKAMCYDHGDALNMHELERVYRDVKTLVGDKLDVVWYQGCLMGAVEVASVSKDYFDYMVSHETVRYGSENAQKFPNLIAEINGNPDGDEAAEKAVTVETAPNTSFAASYDLSEYDDVESSIRSFADAALGHADWETFKSEIETILGTVRRVAPPGTVGSLEPYEQNGDLIDFFDKIAESTERAIPQAILDAAANVSLNAAFLVDETAGNTGGLEGLNGVAIWLPRTPAEFNNYAAEYSGFDFTTVTRWLEFLAELYGVAYRIEATWGAVPNDIDSHLYDAQDPPGHILWTCKTCIDGAALDRDVTTSYGPENMRISFLADGPLGHYEYWLYNWSGTTSTEVVTVKVFRGSAPQPVKTYLHTFNEATMRGWHVCNIETDGGAIIDVDTSAATVPYGISKDGLTK
jgi:hypothetical protein